MKRIIPAAIILMLTIILCVCSHKLVNAECAATTKNINKYINKNISSNKLQNDWQHSKDKMSLFVNHKFLDDISIYIGQLTTNNQSSQHYLVTIQNIQTVLSIITEEQKIDSHTFY